MLQSTRLQRVVHYLVTKQQFRACVHLAYVEVKIKEVTVLLSLNEIWPTILFPRNHTVDSTP